MQNLISDHMLVVFFIYGLAFFLLGIAILLQPRRGSAFNLGNSLWLLAGFGLLHSVGEWMDMFLTLGETYWTPLGMQLLKIASFYFGAASFVFLLQFSLRIISQNRSKYKFLERTALGASLLFLVVESLYGISTGFNGQWLLQSQILVRYLIGFPGAILTAIGFWQQRKLSEIQGLSSRYVDRSLMGMAFVFALYGCFAGLVVPGASLFPASVLNYATFKDAVGIPIQICRTACALAAAYFISGILNIFNLESNSKLEKANAELTLTNEQLETRVLERTLELTKVNESLLAYITERNQVNEQLRESEEKYRTILEQVENGYVELDLKGVYTFVNDSFCRTSGFSANELLGASYKKFFDLEHIQLLRDAYNHIYKTGETLKGIEYEVTKKDGTKVFVEESVSLKRDASGRPIGFMGIRRDCTERKQIETQLVDARDEALESTRLKSEFLANMSHEIRTPMNGVIGMTGLLLDTKLDAEQRDFAETIRSSADSLLTIINDILDFSKIEAGKLQFEILDFDLRSVVEDSVELLADRALDKNIELASLIPCNFPTALRGDPGRVRQVLTNLVGNAVKFTERGEVIVRASKEIETDTSIMVRFTVSDTGIGISPAAQKNLFLAFNQADGSTTRKYGGTGLGLCISRQLIGLMNGEIGVTSTPGEGSTFWFTAQFEKQPVESVAVPPVKRSLDKLRVLIVDDNATNRRILCHQSRCWGMVPTETESGRQALTLLSAAALEGAAYDLAILDLMMPEMDGFDLARAIKATPEIARVPLVLLTSFGERRHSEVAQEVGIAAYLTKPVRETQLFDCLTTVMGNAMGPAANESVLPWTKRERRRAMQKEKTMSNKLILVAEDNIVNQKVAMRQLQKLGYRADAVSDGREALEALGRIPYDLVLMDCQMPEMDGYEATVKIRSREGITKHTPIVAMTANALEGDRAKCLAAGMDDYVSKPVESEELERVLERFLGNGRENAKSNDAVFEENAVPV